MLSVVDSRSGVVHLVAMETAALHRHSGRYPALCGVEVISASMLAGPGRECADCVSLAQADAGVDRRRKIALRRRFPLLWLRRSRLDMDGTPGRRCEDGADQSKRERGAAR